jgi:DHA2 family multidrug resistance protein
MSEGSASAAHQDDRPVVPLRGIAFAVAAVAAAFGNVMAVLDISIAQVSIPNIAAGLGASPREGTYVITAYAVAEAMTVLMTGWLAQRFGAARAFVASMVLFGVTSVLCGMAKSLEALVIFRFLQGAAGGPMVPLSQALLLEIFPKSKRDTAIGIWTLTAVIGPIAGPICGGYICDNWNWPWIFLVNMPFAIAGAYVCWRLLVPHDPPPQRFKVDVVGFVLIAIWVGALQIVLDRGQDLDWLGSAEIVILSIVAVVGFAAFLIWELTEPNPIVDLKIFRHRGYAIMFASLTLTMCAWIGQHILQALWLQINMGYTSLLAGFVLASSALLILGCGSVIARVAPHVDLRVLYCTGLVFYTAILLYQAHYPPDVTFSTVFTVQSLTGICVALFFAPAMSLALSFVEPREVPGAAGLISFSRTLATAITTSFSTMSWQNWATRHRAAIADRMDSDMVLENMRTFGFSHDELTHRLDNLVQSQSVMAATNDLFMIYAFCMIIGAISVWLVPPPRLGAPTVAAH